MQRSYPGVVGGTQGDTHLVGQLGHVQVTRTERVRLDETAELQGIVWRVESNVVMICLNYSLVYVILPIISSGKVT